LSQQLGAEMTKTTALEISQNQSVSQGMTLEI
jgi:hypothetical protein